jgi:hypothetical protein
VEFHGAAPPPAAKAACFRDRITLHLEGTMMRSSMDSPELAEELVLLPGEAEIRIPFEVFGVDVDCPAAGP